MDADTFVATWGLDATSRAVLDQLSPQVQQKVMEEFAPKPTTQNVDRLFQGFARSVQGKEQGSDQCLMWCQQQGFDQSCLDALASLSPEQREAVMNEFCPKPGTRNVQGLFLGFCRSVKEGAGSKGAAAKAAADVQWQPWTAVVPDGHGAFAMAAQAEAEDLQTFQAQADVSGLAPSDEEMALFQQQWGLDANCTSVLRGQTADIQRHVLQSFAPKPGTRNINSLFMGFLRSISAGGVLPQASGAMQSVPAKPVTGPGRTSSVSQGSFAGAGVVAGRTPLWGGVRAAPVVQARPAAGPLAGMKRSADSTFGAWGALTHMSPGSIKVANPVSSEELFQFAQTWGLDTECLAALAVHGPEVQRDVVDRFKPKPGTRDLKSLFMGFLKSRASGPGAGKQPRLM